LFDRIHNEVCKYGQFKGCNSQDLQAAMTLALENDVLDKTCASRSETDSNALWESLFIIDYEMLSRKQIKQAFSTLVDSKVVVSKEEL